MSEANIKLLGTSLAKADIANFANIADVVQRLEFGLAKAETGV